MARPNKSLNRDWPQLESVAFAGLAAGSAADPAQDIILAALPDLTRSYLPSALNQGIQGDLPQNRMWLRAMLFTSQGAANTVGNATNNCDLRVNVWRNGVLQGCVAYYSFKVATTITPAITATGVQTVALASATNVVAGMALGVDTAGAFEVVYVISVSGANITANFTKTHSGGVAATSILQPFVPIAFVPASGPATTTSSTAVTSGSTVITPASMYGIHVGDQLLVDTGGSAEVVTVTAVTNTTFTAVFANAHSGTYAVVTNPATGSLANGARFELRGGDVVSINRLSNNVTGLATPAGLAEIEWVPSVIGQ